MRDIAPCLDISDVSYAYGSVPVLQHVSLSVRPGEYVGIIGENGGGKTTLLKLILGLLPSASGSITLFGTPLAAFRDHHLLGYVPQRIAQADFPASVFEVVESGRTAACAHHHLEAGDAARDIEWALAITGIAHLADRRLSDLSGGQRQRVFIARALAGRPRMLLLDEPTTGIDPVSQQQFYELLQHLHAKHGITILFVSHDVGTLERYASRILSLNCTLRASEASAGTLTHPTGHGSHHHH